MTDAKVIGNAQLNRTMNGYTKLFSSILDSSIWTESKETRLVWITMLAMADREGRVDAAVPGLADRAKVSLPECIAALKLLSEPDQWSRSSENEGRRIQAVDGGWIILNHGKYRAKLSLEERRAYLAKKQAEYRAKKKSVHRNITINELVNERVLASEALEKDLK